MGEFTQCRVESALEASILVAVELDHEAQVLLQAAENSFEALVARGYSYAADLAHTPLTTGESPSPASYPGDIGNLH